MHTSWPKMLLFSLLICCCSNASAQTKKVSLTGQQEIEVSYGAMSLYRFGKVFDFDDDYGFPYLDLGPIFATYKYYVADVLNIGITVGEEYFKGDFSTYFSSGWSKIGTYTEKNKTISAEMQFVYFRRRLVRFYSGFGVGYNFDNRHTNYNQDYLNQYPGDKYSETENMNYRTMQLIAFGVRAGHNIGAFAELGFGYKGLINGGVSYIFPSSRERANTAAHADR